MKEKEKVKLLPANLEELDDVLIDISQDAVTEQNVDTFEFSDEGISKVISKCI